MNKLKFTFTFFTDDNKVYGYIFNVTTLEAQKRAEEIYNKNCVHVYYMEGYYEE